MSLPNNIDISLIVAVSRNGVIGNNGQLPWHLPYDMTNFKKITSGNTVIMGRKTWESIGKPLPNRRNIVISRSLSFLNDKAEVYSSLETAISHCTEKEHVFIIGGSQIYNEAFKLDILKTLYLTVVDVEIQGDSFFKIPNLDRWMLQNTFFKDKDDKNAYNMSMQTYKHYSTLF